MKSKISSITGFLIMMCLSLPLVAQENATLRVAVFDPSAVGVSEGTKIVVREMISSVFVNTGKYSIVERSLLDQIMKEQEFSHTDAVDENQATQLGKLAGAHKVVLSVVTQVDNRNMLSIKIIDVQTATVEKQKAKIINRNTLLDEIEPLTQELLGERVIRSAASNPTPAPTITVAPAKVKTPAREQQLDFIFKGERNKKNPTVKLYIDNQFIGEGSLNAGFQLKYTDTQPGTRKLRAEWSGVVPGKSYTINTTKYTRFEFEYKTAGFGYAFVLVKKKRVKQ
jgi:hypothetical protein